MHIATQSIQIMSDNVRMEYIPKQTTALLQHMDQGVITNFKAYYQRRTFHQLIKAVDGVDKPSVRDFWKSYNIMDTVNNTNNYEKCMEKGFL